MSFACFSRFLVVCMTAGVAVAQVTERVSVTSAGGQASHVSEDAVISADGRYVAFSSTASDLVPLDTNNARDIFVRDMVSGTTERVSIGSGGQANGQSNSPSISADGRYVAFASTANNLIPPCGIGGCQRF